MQELLTKNSDRKRAALEAATLLACQQGLLEATMMVVSVPTPCSRVPRPFVTFHAFRAFVTVSPTPPPDRHPEIRKEAACLGVANHTFRIPHAKKWNIIF